MTTVEVLRGAREWLRDPAHWTKGTAYRDRSGTPVGIGENRRIVSTCALGSCGRLVGNDPVIHGAILALDSAVPEGQFSGFASLYNDRPETTHADILALFDRAIAAEEAKLPIGNTAPPEPLNEAPSYRSVTPQATPRRRESNCERVAVVA